MTLPRVLALTGDETGCILWRIWLPFEELKRHGVIADWTQFDGCPGCGQLRPDEYRINNEPLKCFRCGLVSRASDALDLVYPYIGMGQYDAIIAPRISWPRDSASFRVIDALHKAGVALIFECDDDMFSPGIVERQYRVFPKERAKGMERLEWEREQRIAILADHDAITVASRRLKTVIEQYTDTPVYHVPNMMSVRWFTARVKEAIRHEALQGHLVIGWSGGSREDEDFLQVAEAWSVIAERYPHVMFAIQGYISPKMADAVPKDRRVTMPMVPVSVYPRAFSNFDIGCCSVAPTIFNWSKTPIKWFEFTLAGAPCVVSPTLYGPVVNHGQDALVANTTEEWIEHLSSLVESDSRRREIAANAWATVVTHHSLEHNWHKWVDAWTDAIGQFRERRARQLVVAGG